MWKLFKKKAPTRIEVIKIRANLEYLIVSQYQVIEDLVDRIKYKTDPNNTEQMEAIFKLTQHNEQVLREALKYLDELKELR